MDANGVVNVLRLLTRLEQHKLVVFGVSSERMRHCRPQRKCQRQTRRKINGESRSHGNCQSGPFFELNRVSNKSFSGCLPEFRIPNNSALRAAILRSRSARLPLQRSSTVRAPNSRQPHLRKDENANGNQHERAVRNPSHAFENPSAKQHRDKQTNSAHDSIESASSSQRGQRVARLHNSSRTFHPDSTAARLISSC